MQYTNGSPNMSDFYQERINPSMKLNNTKPWEEERVAPGLNQGYGTKGSGGFNSGVESRDQWRPKSVDELRVATNPKNVYTYVGHEGPALAPVKNMGNHAKVDKKLPDRYFEQDADRWLTTTGGSGGAATSRSEQMHKDQSRVGTTREYFGGSEGQEKTGTYAPQNYEEPHKIQLEGKPIINPSAQGHHVTTNADHGMKSYANLANNRSVSNMDSRMGIVSGTMRAAVAPLMDILRPSNKENVIGNMRPTGNPGTTVTSSRLYAPGDRPSTTNREITGHSLFHMNVQGQNSDGYLAANEQPVANQRDTTNTSYIGASSGMSSIARAYDAEYKAQTNANKEMLSKNRMNHGSTQRFEHITNVNIGKLEMDRENNRNWIPSNMPRALPNKSQIGQLQGRQTYKNDNNSRMDSSLLTAFKQNPYTHSLHSSV
jgi:hypothetical protein